MPIFNQLGRFMYCLPFVIRICWFDRYDFNMIGMNFICLFNCFYGLKFQIV